MSVVCYVSSASRFMKCLYPKRHVFGSLNMQSSTGQLIQAAFAILYVSSIYAHPSGRLRFTDSRKPGDARPPAPARSRNDPVVIRTRLAAVSVATALCCSAVAAALWNANGRKQVRSLLRPTHRDLTKRGRLPADFHRSAEGDG